MPPMFVDSLPLSSLCVTQWRNVHVGWIQSWVLTLFWRSVFCSDGSASVKKAIDSPARSACATPFSVSLDASDDPWMIPAAL